jgi:hypothetical protein
VPRNTFENEWPTQRRLQNVRADAQREFDALLAERLDIRQLMVELMR